jgi:hypothetical protein
MRKRLEQLNWQMQPRSLKNGDPGEVMDVPGSELPEL